MEEKIGLLILNEVNSLQNVSICLSVSISHINILYIVVYLVDVVLKTLVSLLCALGLVLNTIKIRSCGLTETMGLIH